jgi:hypothetical protein
VKQAVEKAFKVTVTAVNIMTVRGPEKRVGRKMVAANSWKKSGGDPETRRQDSNLRGCLVNKEQSNGINKI